MKRSWSGSQPLIDTPPAVIGRLLRTIAGARRGELTSARGSVEDFWDPKGVPGPIDIALSGQPKPLRWWFHAGGRR